MRSFEKFAWIFWFMAVMIFITNTVYAQEETETPSDTVVISVTEYAEMQKKIQLQQNEIKILQNAMDRKQQQINKLMTLFSDLIVGLNHVKPEIPEAEQTKHEKVMLALIDNLINLFRTVTYGTTNQGE